MTFRIELEREDDGRWLAEAPALSGVMCYGRNRDDAIARVQALALRVMADRLEHGETRSECLVSRAPHRSRRPAGLPPGLFTRPAGPSGTSGRQE